MNRAVPLADDSGMSAAHEPFESATSGVTSPRLANAIPDFALSALCLFVWIAPGRMNPAVVQWIVLTMLLEFIVIHSAAFMGQQLFARGSGGRRAAIVFGLGLFYTLFVGAFALAFHTAWPLATFWVLTLNRMIAVISGEARGGEGRTFVQAGWAASTLCYLIGCGLTTVLPLPRLGFSPAFVASLHLPGSGLWIEQPWRVVAFGALYFGAVGAFECSGFRAFRSGVPGAKAGVVTPIP